MARRSMDELYRSWLAAQTPQVRTATATGVTPANGALIEFPFVGRERLAIQVVGAFTGTIEVQGSLLDDSQTSVNGVTAFTTPGADADWVTLESITAPGITQLDPTGLFSRIRVRVTALSAGTPQIRIL